MSALRRLLAVAGAAALTAACAAVGPNYRLPEGAVVNAPAAKAAFVGADFAAVNQAPVPDDWWRLYDDPVLDGLVEQALAANADLRVAAANLERAQAAVRETVAAGEPQGGLSATAARDQASGESFLLPHALPAENLADAGFKVSYQIDLFGRLRRAAEAAKADADASQAALEAARVTTAAETARAYVEACSAGEQAAAAGRLLDLQQRAVSVAERMERAGRGAPIDVLRAKAQADQLRAEPPVFEAQRRAALYKLAVLTGKPPAEFPKSVAACSRPPAPSGPIPVGDGAGLLKRRPDVRQAERVLAGSTARIGVAVAALYPSVSLGLSAGATGLLADIGQPATQRWSFGPLISWTFPGGGERARIAEAEAGQKAALARFDGVVLNALRETETGLTLYAHDLDRHAALKAARDEAAQAADQARRLYTAGRSPYLSGLDAERSLAAAESALAASDARLSLDQVNLFLALGGGWSGGGQAGATKG
ncbi:RND transporter [Caulobacter sp. CCUG 60055]|uniref:efflux transporter outer membrane subunit n=1 Tax=Caulobacter sp. CCUG 60055 TaxID=2100090 RepID=UPI001FA7978D|nr:efflux transporter outer membrane subunit [Caulobacter sp. CCUG 60055]MCI3179082.1 RND transporter [Caulobacter sp. CCUG 60055]